jgi:hypothetical protein
MRDGRKMPAHNARESKILLIPKEQIGFVS